MTNFNNFPEYLRQNAKWAVWREEQQPGKSKPDKPPRHPSTGMLLSVNKPDEWGSYDDAVKAYGSGIIWKGIGFLIERKLGIAVIDLDYKDNRPADIQTLHKRIYERMNSYSEYSPSTLGLHIVCGGYVPAARAFDVEIYSDQRFMSVTGNVLNPVAVINRQFELEKLVEEITSERKAKGRKPLDHSAPEKESDDTIITKAHNAVNGTKFKSLWEGDWRSLNYPSQSEADFALVNMLCYYSQNIVQIRRLFFKSGLGQRDKLVERAGLLDSIIAAGFDRLIPEIDTSALRKQLDAKIAEQANAMTVPAAVSKRGVAMSALAPPPGMLGEVCRWFYQAAAYPVPQVALAGGLAFMAGLCGAGWNINSNGLNLFILLTAPTATGKDILTNGTARLLENCKNAPSVYTGTKLNFDWMTDMVGPSVIGSGAALTKSLTKDFLSTLSIQSEFGLELEKLQSRNASVSQLQLRKMYLDLAVRSGATATLGRDIWSDTDKNTATRRAISFSLLGESVPEKIYNNLDESQVSDGFMGRFLLIECPQALEAFNASAGFLKPDPMLIERIIAMGAFASERCRMQTPVNVNSTLAAAACLEGYRASCRAKHTSADAPVYMGLWSRCHVKAMKLAALVAVGKNYENPIIEIEDAEWAIEVVNRGTIAIMERFERGEIGSDDKARLSLFHSLIEKYVKGQSGLSGKYYRPEWHAKRQIAKSHLHSICTSRPQFRDDKLAFERCFKAFIETGAITLVPQAQAGDNFTGVLLQITADAI